MVSLNNLRACGQRAVELITRSIIPCVRLLVYSITSSRIRGWSLGEVQPPLSMYSSLHPAQSTYAAGLAEWAAPSEGIAPYARLARSLLNSRIWMRHLQKVE